jgi:DNA-binding transcriptional regulator YiaG
MTDARLHAILKSVKTAKKTMKKAQPARSVRKRRARASSSFATAGTTLDRDPVRRLSRTYHLSSEALSRVTGASPRTVAYWNAGMAPQRSSAQKLKEVTRLFDALSDIIKAKAIGPWLQRPNKQFDGSTPLQVMERGESDRLWRMIWQLREGNAG